MANKAPRHVRGFLAPATDADSYVHLTLHFGNDGGVNLKLSDCDRGVNLWFAANKDGRKKWNVLRAALNKAEDHLFAVA